MFFRILLLLPGSFGLGCSQGLFDTHRTDTAPSTSEAHYKQITYEPGHSSLQESETWRPDNRFVEEPWSLRHEIPKEYLDLTIEQALQIALQNATILSDLGGTILTTPSTVPSKLDPEVIETDPQFGVESALSQFDARVRSIGQFQNNDRPFNNFIIGGGTQLFRQDYHDYLVELSKKTATGAEFSARNSVDYDANNRPQNTFRSAWEAQLEMEVRQPLLQGAGIEFNRIAGPNGRPGVMQGIVIARINTDIAITDFEMGLRDFISNVENAYWDLFFAYRLLDTTLEARDQSLKTWKATISRIDQKGITAAKEAQAREQYYRFEEEMRNALAGRTRNATQTRNGSQPGTFVGAGGLYVAERRLRLLMGLPLKEEAVIRPVSEPKLMPIDYEWSALVHEAVDQRPELKKQRQILKSLELQKEASRSFTKPRLDAFGRYRFRGLGDNLFGAADNNAVDLHRGAYGNLFHGDFQEWELGVEMTLPVGFRQGHSAVRNLEFRIARERAMLDQQERQIIHDLSNALAELRRVQEVSEISYNRLLSAQQRFSSLNEESDSPDEILDAQVRLAEAKTAYYRSLVEHEAALRNIHYEKGSLLPFRHVILSDHYSDEDHTYWENCRSELVEIEPLTSEIMAAELPVAETESPESEGAEPEPEPRPAAPAFDPPQSDNLPPVEPRDEPGEEDSLNDLPAVPDETEVLNEEDLSLDYLSEHPLAVPAVDDLPQRTEASRDVQTVETNPFAESAQDSPLRFVPLPVKASRADRPPQLVLEDDEWQNVNPFENQADRTSE